jgi:hypothetical protein
MGGGVLLTGSLHPSARELFTSALSTMQAVAYALRDEPDCDGALTRLAERIEAERAWVLAEMILGQQPRRPPGWSHRRLVHADSQGIGDLVGI